MMSFRNWRIIIFSIIICAQFILSFTSFGIQSDEHFLGTYKREKTKLRLSFKSIHDSLKQLENYLIDNFRGRMDLINANANLSFMLGASVDPEKIILGKDGWFFLGDNTDNVISQHLGEQVMTNQRVESLVEKFNKLQKRLKKLDKQFLMVIVPNKHSVYPEKLPYGLEKAKVTNMSKITNVKSIDMLDLTPFLIEQKERRNNFIYYKTDSHWTELGAYLAYKQICKKLGIGKSDVLELSLEEFKLKPYNPGYGLTRIIGLTVPDKKQFNQATKKQLRNGLVFRDWTLKNNYKALTEHFTLKNDSKITVKNSNAPSKLKVLVVGDSFKVLLFDYFNQTFQSVSYLHYNKSEASKILQTVETLDPDIVIYQVIERNIGSVAHLRAFK